MVWLTCSDAEWKNGKCQGIGDHGCRHCRDFYDWEEYDEDFPTGWDDYTPDYEEDEEEEDEE